MAVRGSFDDGVDMADDERVFNHERLRVYQLAERVYADGVVLVRRLPWQQRHLATQLMRAAASIVLNLAEGCGELSPPEKARFFRMSLRSVNECGAIVSLLCRVAAVDPAQAQVVHTGLLDLAPRIASLARKQKPAP
ncbi:MAG: four helix bundle protein [Gemmatimonadota bacterium]